MDIFEDILRQQALLDLNVNDRKAVLRRLSLNGDALEFLTDYQSDEEAVLTAIRVSPYAIKFAHPSLLNDLVFAMKAVSVSGSCYIMLPADIQMHEDVAIMAADNAPYIVRLAPPLVRDNLKVMATAIKHDNHLYRYCSEHLLSTNGPLLRHIANIEHNPAYDNVDVLQDIHIEEIKVLYT